MRKLHFVLFNMVATWTLVSSPAWAQYTLSTLGVFNVSNGNGPLGNLVLDAAGNLYGLTNRGGATDGGTLFEVPAGTQSITTVASFVNATTGSQPTSGLSMDSDGNLYGTTVFGGQAFGGDEGTVFELPAGSQTLATLAVFNVGSVGTPVGALIPKSNGNLYGAASDGGSNQRGGIFQWSANTHALSMLGSFTLESGFAPQGGPISDAQGNLYGVTIEGGLNGTGTVYEYSASTHSLSAIYSFGPSNAGAPNGALAFDTEGNLYGVTRTGGSAGRGTVFEIAADTHTFSTLTTFTGNNGANPVTGLIADASGNLFGTTSFGGASGYGTVFEITTGTHTLQTLATFDGTNGQSPANLVLDPAGNIFGTTQGGPNGNGPNGDGTVFELVRSVPEPSTLDLVAMGALLLIAARFVPSRAATTAYFRN
jgi:uncharacterized repeat protein (TIGR03803 family)